MGGASEQAHIQPGQTVKELCHRIGAWNNPGGGDHGAENDTDQQAQHGDLRRIAQAKQYRLVAVVMNKVVKENLNFVAKIIHKLRPCRQGGFLSKNAPPPCGGEVRIRLCLFDLIMPHC